MRVRPHKQPINRDYTHPVVDVLRTFGQNAAAQVPAGLTGIGSLIMNQDASKAVEDMERVQSALGYQPKTLEGEASAYALGKAFEPIEKGLDAAGEWTLDKTGSPVLAAVVRSVPEAAADLFLPTEGVRAAKAGAAPKSAAGSVPKNFRQSGMIHGPRSNLADKQILEHAEMMKKEGFSDDEIFAETLSRGQGWYMGHPDGVPRFETSDVASVYRPEEVLVARRDRVRNSDEGKFINDAMALDQYLRMDKGNGEKYTPEEAYQKLKEYVQKYEGRDPHPAAWKAVVDEGMGTEALKAMSDRFEGNMPDPRNLTMKTQETLLDSPALAGYPKIARSPVTITPLGGSQGESWDGMIKLDSGIGYRPDTVTPDGAIMEHGGKSVLLHEIQHEIQALERMASGGGASFARMAKDDVMRKYLKAELRRGDLTDGEIDAMLKDVDKGAVGAMDQYTLENAAYNAYKRIAGEAEARLVQARSQMTQAEMDADPFWKHYGSDTPYSLEELIHKRRGGTTEILPKGLTFEQWLKRRHDKTPDDIKGDKLMEDMARRGFAAYEVSDGEGIYLPEEPSASVPPRIEVITPENPMGYSKAVGGAGRKGVADVLRQGTRVELAGGDRPDIPKVSIQEFEGHPFVTVPYDRTSGWGDILGIDGEPLKYPVHRWGGQTYMNQGRGRVGASTGKVTEETQAIINYLRQQHGKDPLFLPSTMGPSASDFGHQQVQTMLSHAAANLNGRERKSLDAMIRKRIPDWVGIDNPMSQIQIGKVDGDTRKAVMSMMDVGLRKIPSYKNSPRILDVGRARIANVDPVLMDMEAGRAFNVGRATGRKTVDEPFHYSYDRAIEGEPVGELIEDTPVSILLGDNAYKRREGDFYIDPWRQRKGVEDPWVKMPRPQERSLETNIMGGLITDKIIAEILRGQTK